MTCTKRTIGHSIGQLEWPFGEDDFRVRLLDRLRTAGETVQVLAVVVRATSSDPWELAFARIDVGRKQDIPATKEVNIGLVRSFCIPMNPREFTRWLETVASQQRIEFSNTVVVETDALGRLNRADRRYSPDTEYGTGWPCDFVTGPSIEYCRPNARLRDRRAGRAFTDVQDFVASVSGFSIPKNPGAVSGRHNRINMIIRDYSARITNVELEGRKVTVSLEGTSITDLDVIVDREGYGEPRWRESRTTPAATTIAMSLEEAPERCVRVQVVGEEGPPADEWYLWPTPASNDVQRDAQEMFDDANRAARFGVLGGAEGQTTILNQTFRGPVGAVQNAPNATANLVQNIGNSEKELLGLLQRIADCMETKKPEQREEAIQLVSALEEELQAPTPNATNMRAFSTALEAVLVGTAAALLAEFMKKLFGL